MIKHPFYELLSQYVTSPTKNDSAAKEKFNQIHEQLLNMIEQEEVTPAIVVQSLSDIYSKNLSRYLFIIQIMRTIVYTTKMKGGYLYPEFFWIIVKNNTFFETDNMHDLIDYIAEFCDRNILRAYLTYLLMTSEEYKQMHILKAFYYIGYSVQTLKVVIQTLPINENNAKLYNIIYSDVMSFTFSEHAKLLSIQEKSWLQDFFTKGLTLGDNDVIKSCQKALGKLAVLNIE
jgi:hypothetical protein